MNFRKIVNSIFKFITRGSERSVNAKKSIIGMLFLKGASIITSLVLVPITIGYVNSFEYGIWIVISSIVGWLSFFDIGLGNGLRYNLIQAIIREDYSLARSYVSSTYAILMLIIAPVWIISLIGCYFINWNNFLNIPASSNVPIQGVMMIVISTFSGQFVLGLINTILNALQKPIFASLYSFFSQVLVLLGIVVLRRYTSGSLLSLSILLGGANIFVLITFSVFFYTTRLKKYRPSYSYVNLDYFKTLFTVGGKYFLLQIIALVYYETNNIIITKILNPSYVTVYNVAFKYLSVLSMIFSIIIAPFWSAFIEAKEKEDFQWMQSVTKKLYCSFWIVCSLGIILFAVSPWVFELWLKGTVVIPISLTLLLLLWQLINVWNTLHSSLIYGFGSIKLQLIGSGFLGILNIPLTVYFCREWMLTGVVFSQIILALSISWIGYIQLKKLLHREASGIWIA